MNNIWLSFSWLITKASIRCQPSFSKNIFLYLLIHPYKFIDKQHAARRVVHLFFQSYLLQPQYWTLRSQFVLSSWSPIIESKLISTYLKFRNEEEQLSRHLFIGEDLDMCRKGGEYRKEKEWFQTNLLNHWWRAECSRQKGFRFLVLLKWFIVKIHNVGIWSLKEM